MKLELDSGDVEDMAVMSRILLMLRKGHDRNDIFVTIYITTR